MITSPELVSFFGLIGVSFGYFFGSGSQTSELRSQISDFRTRDPKNSPKMAKYRDHAPLI